MRAEIATANFVELRYGDVRRIPLPGTDVKIRPPPGGASSIKSLMFVLSKAEQFGVPMRLLPHTTGVCRGFGCTKQSRRRTKATTSPYFHPFGVALQQGPWTTGVKIALAAALFHGFGVARQGPWNTWVNKGKKKGRSCSTPRPSL